MPLKNQDEKEVTKELSGLLMRLAKLYQVPSFDEVNALILAEWLLDEYKHHDLELVQTALRNPPKLNDQAWRITPDTLRLWIDSTRVKRVDEIEKLESRKRQETNHPKIPLSPEMENKIENLKKQLAANMGQKQITGVGAEMMKIRKEDEDRIQGRKAAAIEKRKQNEAWIETDRKKREAVKKRGLDKILNLSELKSFEIEDKIIVARNQEEAEEMYIEIYC